ncbi:MAG: OsmC family protein [Gammaproteobacteria bacterium]|nr:MAG: OsmC family protein [Gammaproteobacteria bacterium]
MKAKIRWLDEAIFVGETGSGHALVIEGPPEAGGQNRGPRPMELLLLGLGSCSAFDVVHILKKGRHAVADCRVEINAERADTDPKVFTRIHLNFFVSGKGLDEKAVSRAVNLSAEKYCSASIMLGKACTITHDFTIETDGC